MSDVSLAQLPPPVSAADPLPSSPSLTLTLKQEPCYDSNIVPEAGM